MWAAEVNSVCRFFLRRPPCVCSPSHHFFVLVRCWSLSLFLLGFSFAALAVEQSDVAGLFGYKERRNEGFGMFPQWVSVMQRHAADMAAPQNCPVNLCRVPEWQSLIAALQGRGLREQVLAVNEFANRFRYVLDQDNYGRSDYWAIPREFLTLGGDCEDYAIIKYFSLRQLGVPAEVLRIVVVQDTNLRIPHAVLALRVQDDIIVLDNQIRDVVSHRKVAHYLPVFSVNEQYWWMHLP